MPFQSIPFFTSSLSVSRTHLKIERVDIRGSFEQA